MTDTNKLFLIITAAILGYLFYLLSPVLMPFFISALLAYLADPIVDKLEEKKLSRTLSVSIVFAVFIIDSATIITRIITIVNITNRSFI